MTLAMKTACERCKAPLDAAGEAYICAYECTFCPECVQALEARCPTCGGELVRRPRRERPN